ncbi:hypothetical protein FCJ59_31575 [Cupriavidus basilensis]|nr:hypothetical protein [Cupriavidus basilensis]
MWSERCDAGSSSYRNHLYCLRTHADSCFGEKVTSVLHLVGPGGAGKTSVGSVLAQRLGWQFIDLDERFMSFEGNIGAFIATLGYGAYAKQNIAVYRRIRCWLAAPTVLALSSGFLTYPEDIDHEYQALRCSIESDALTSLLLPAFELEPCVEIIVQRLPPDHCLKSWVHFTAPARSG